MTVIPSFIIWPYLSSAEAFVTNEFKQLQQTQMKSNTVSLRFLKLIF